jgi:hypothetical protein
MDVSFFDSNAPIDTKASANLGTWDIPTVPRIGEQITLTRPDEDSLVPNSWTVIDVIHDIDHGDIVCYVAVAVPPTHRLGMVWSETLEEPPFVLPSQIACELVPRVGDTIALETMNHDQLELLEQSRELTLGDFEHDTVVSQLRVVDVRHEADRRSDNRAEVVDVTLVVAVVPPAILPDSST